MWSKETIKEEKNSGDASCVRGPGEVEKEPTCIAPLVPANQVYAKARVSKNITISYNSDLRSCYNKLNNMI